jgi:hypothetical protein
MSNTSTAEKTAARQLRDLTGAAYQSCLSTVRVLGPLAQQLDIGDLADILGAHPATTHVSVPECALGNTYEPVPGGSLVCDMAGSVIIDSRGAPRRYGTSVYLPLTRVDGALDASVTLFLDLEGDGESATRPAGLWEVDMADYYESSRRFADGLNTAGIVNAAPAMSMKPPREGVPHDAYISELIMTAAPEFVSAGPGFDWAHMSFESLGLVSDEPHDDELCDRHNCGYLHDWPSADKSRRGIVVPMPLLEAYRELVTIDDWEEDNFCNEHMYTRVRLDRTGRDWFGLDMPQLSRLWLTIPSPPLDCAAPDW